MGEGIPLRWLKFEKAKAATKEGMMKMSQVQLPRISNMKLSQCNQMSTGLNTIVLTLTWKLCIKIK